MNTIGAPSDHGSTDTEHQAPKQNPSKTDKADRGPLFKGPSTQNKANPLFDLQSFKTFASLGKQKYTHTVDWMGPLPQMDFKDKFDFANSKAKAEALNAQAKPASANEAKSTFTFPAMKQGPSKINVTDVPFPKLLSTGILTTLISFV